ncbi:hypothetical protein NL108_018060 [Boleophthalmus pectinirostris]|uniref:salivary glue protein Sgs-3-like n=1 Tax=Boleophthalmus pectinirostris TaxID=150288 RepID=UPI00242DF44B|nr:salivary glue protein Sgs-3-like [Boleophthalmus pectinirostris]KAJ0069113.1 hypothetical protein NL108_018060 [Boleophthalmus pectinirostris]
MTYAAVCPTICATLECLNSGSYYFTDPVSCCNTTNCNPPANAALSITTTTTTTTTAPPTTTTSTTTPLPAISSSTEAPNTKTDSGSFIFLKMSVNSLGDLSNATLSEAVLQFLREQLNTTGFVVSVKKISQPETETPNTTSAPGPTQAPPTP